MALGPTVVNLNLHGIGPPRRELEVGEEPFWVTEERFLALVDEVARQPRIRLSFDDGNASDADIALPALVDRGLRATFFVIADRIGTPGSLGRDEIRALISHGMTIGSHGMHHRPWRGLDPSERREEWVDARRCVEEAAGWAVDVVACPLGAYDRATLSALRRLGYRRVFTSDPLPARPNAWLQPRYTVREDSTVDALRRDVAGPPPVERARRIAKGLIKRWR